MSEFEKIKRQALTHKIQTEDAKAVIDNINYHYTQKMCKKCKFYNKGCTKKRIPENCAKQGFKDKE